MAGFVLYVVNRVFGGKVGAVNWYQKGLLKDISNT